MSDENEAETEWPCNRKTKYFFKTTIYILRFVVFLSFSFALNHLIWKSIVFTIILSIYIWALYNVRSTNYIGIYENIFIKKEMKKGTYSYAQ